MPISEAARHDLYNGLTDLLGPERAETFMAAYNPDFDPTEVATKADMADLRTDLRDIRLELAGMNARIDRLFLTLLAGLFVITAAMVGILFSTL